jgi:hypothetical protein
VPNIEYLLPNIGRTVPSGDPGSGECRGLGGVRVGVAFAFLRVPDAWPDTQFPCFYPCGALACLSLSWGCCRPSPFWGNLLSHPCPVWQGFVLPLSLVSFLSLQFLMGWQCLLGTFLLLIFLPFLSCTLPLLFSCAILPHPLHPDPSLLLPPPSSSGPVGDLKGTVQCCGLGH